MLNESKKPKNISLLESKKPLLIFKSRLIFFIRQYFIDKGFIEVFTPILIDAPAPEEYIEAPSCGKQFLRTSPELEMKQMLAAGYDKIFQIGSCFREGEKGRLHNPEFFMLEWYEVNSDYNDIMIFSFELLQYLSDKLKEDSKISSDFFASYAELKVKDAFAQFANITPEKALENSSFEEVLLDNIEPNLGNNHPLFLKDYPAKCAAFSKLKSNNECERWELYLKGIEIANAYTELIDPIVQRERFAEFIKTRDKTGYKKYPKAKDFLKAIDYGIPQSAGCALGIDRLIMFFTGEEQIKKVLY